MGQKSRWTLPQVVHPPKYRRYVICVPDERFYIAAFEGLLIELTYSKNWQRDNALTAAVVSRVWQDILASAVCEQECTTIIDELEYQMSICEQLRFHNGHLQGLCCGEWVDITGQPSQGTDGPGQPGDGTDQPAPGGGCASYDLKFAATGSVLVPTIVNAGDTVTFSNFNGAGTDGTLHWYCPTGSIFFAGLCVGSLSFDGSDPAPSLHHMAIVAKIGAVYYDVTAGPITVPGGIVNEQVIVQVNDGSLSNNGGDYSLTAEVCNNLAAPWVAILDFRLGPQGFGVDAGSPGVWTAGAGWTNTDATPDSVTYRRGVQAIRVVPSFVCTRMILTLNDTQGITDTPSDISQHIGLSAGVLWDKTYTTAVSGTPCQFDSGPISVTGTVIELRAFTDRHNGSTAGFTGSNTLKTLEIHGTGTNPF